jgi:hypothetical protein
VATALYEVKIIDPRRRVVEEFSTHLDVEGDEDVLHGELRRLLSDAVRRSGWTRKTWPDFKLTARKPGWAHDAFPPYALTREEV